MELRNAECPMEGVKVSPPLHVSEEERAKAQKKRARSMEEDMIDGGSTRSEDAENEDGGKADETLETNVEKLETADPLEDLPAPLDSQIDSKPHDTPKPADEVRVDNDNLTAFDSHKAPYGSAKVTKTTPAENRQAMRDTQKQSQNVCTLPR